MAHMDLIRNISMAGRIMRKEQQVHSFDAGRIGLENGQEIAMDSRQWTLSTENTTKVVTDNISLNQPLHLYDITIIIPTVSFAMMILLGILGNSLVIYVILTKVRMRNVTNLFLMNLAFSDMTFLIICGGFTVAHYAFSSWPFGDFMCRAVQYILYTTCYVTTYTLIAISAVRYVTVVHNQWATKVLTLKRTVIIIIGIWIIFCVAKFPIFLIHDVSYDENTNRTECIISSREDGQRLFSTFFVFAYALPLLIICTLYVLILFYLRKKKSNQTKHSHVNNDACRQVTRVIITLVLVFAICWLPLHVHLLTAYYGDVPSTHVYQILLIIWLCLAYLNSLLNPFIYNFCSEDFRNAFKEVICTNRLCCKTSNEPPPVSV